MTDLDEIITNLSHLDIDVTFFKMSDLDDALTDITKDQDIMDMAIEKVAVWIDRNSHHSFPKRYKSWINSLQGNRHLNHVRVYQKDWEDEEYSCSRKVMINAEELFEQLVRRNYLFIDGRRVRISWINSRLVRGDTSRIKRRRITN